MTDNEDVLKDIRLSFYERFSNPVVFSFCVAWFVLHFEVILCIFSYDSYHRKIDFIKDYFNVDVSGYYDLIRARVSELDVSWLSTWADIRFGAEAGAVLSSALSVIYSVLFPFAISLVYIYIVPNFTHSAIAHHVKMKQKLVELRKVAEGLSLVTREEATTLRESVRKQDEKLELLQEELAAKKNVIGSLNDQVKSYRDRVDDVEALSLSRYEVLSVVRHSFYTDLIDKAAPNYYTFDEFFDLASDPVDVKMRPFCRDLFQSMGHLLQNVEFVTGNKDVNLLVTSDGEDILPVDRRIMLDIRGNKREVAGYKNMGVNFGLSRLRFEYVLNRLIDHEYIMSYVDMESGQVAERVSCYRITPKGESILGYKQLEDSKSQSK